MMPPSLVAATGSVMLGQVYLFMLGLVVGGFAMHFHMRFRSDAEAREHFEAHAAMRQTRLARERMLLSMEQVGVLELVRDPTGDLTGSCVLPDGRTLS
jgi:hypothetical protein